MDINVVHRYSHLGEKLLCITYNDLGVKFTCTLQVCDLCARSKAKARYIRNKTYTRLLNPGERIFVNTTGTFLESLIGHWYWIGAVDYYSNYAWGLFTKTKFQLSTKME